MEERTERFATVRYFRQINASAGGGALNDETGAERLALDEAVVAMLGGEGHLVHIDAIHVLGDSMEPLLRDGETIFVDRSRREPSGGGIFVVRTPAGIFVKRLIRRSDGKIELISENPAYASERLEGADVEVIGQVVGKLTAQKL